MHFRLARACSFGLGVLVMMLSVAATLQAAIDPVPEIDAGAVPAALGILSAGVLILRARRLK